MDECPNCGCVGGVSEGFDGSLGCSVCGYLVQVFLFFEKIKGGAFGMQSTNEYLCFVCTHTHTHTHTQQTQESYEMDIEAVKLKRSRFMGTVLQEDVETRGLWISSLDNLIFRPRE